eukprot:100354-Alexandrium_andersonii.AAC.1
MVVPGRLAHPMIDGVPFDRASTLRPSSAVGQGPVDSDLAPVKDPSIADLGPRQRLSGELAANTVGDSAARMAIAHFP